jgi:hypothetical protein
MGLKERITPALGLFFLAPAIGELLSGSSPPLEFFNPFSLFLLCLMYGGGALLVREAVFRWRKGWLSMLLLGAAYGIAEEGLACKSFFDPNWMDIGVLGSYGHWAGVNWIWALELTAFHAVFSISASIILVTLLFPEKRDEAWLSGRGLFLAGAGFAFIIPFCYWLLTPYRPPVVPFAGAILVALGLVLLAWKLPHPLPWEKVLGAVGEQKTASVRWFTTFGLIWTTLLFFFSWIFVSLSPNATLTGLAMLAFFAISGIMLARKTAYGRNWTVLHQHGLVAGSLGFFVFLGAILEIGGVRGMSAVAVGFTLFLFWLRRRLLVHHGKITCKTEERPGVHLST